jgi:hypothetical protein
LIDKAFDVELTQDQLLPRPVEADESFVFVNFTLRIRGLRRIGALILDADEFRVQRTRVLTTTSG